ncbi:MAG: N(4)-(Beta-N-acetylglucosaminyl)-L-asparaginase precursor [Geminicoccaceae bacterium]|nr:N(4)-(Beta-N-acetylglucosaminyl)-L-asparaginase precursor [Geminicoccaceae bacterium]
MPDSKIDRREFVRTTAVGLAAAIPAVPVTASALGASGTLRAPEVLVRSAVKPLVIADASGIQFKNGGTESAVERAFRLITEGKDVLDALIAGVNIPELDPEETGIGYGALPNADGVVQLDASCMHGPKRRAGAVAAIEGVRTPSLVAQAVMDQTDHHLLAGKGAQDFARALGFTIEADLNTERSRRLWLEWRRRMDPDHWLDPAKRQIREKDKHEKDPGDGALSSGMARRDVARRAVEAGWSMVEDGLIPEGTFWGTINCNGINANGDICGVTTTSGLAWKIPGRVGDSPILGAGLYVDNDVGAAGSTGRGEANLYNLCSYLVVESMRRGMHPKDAGMEALKRIRANTVETRLLNSRGLPNFNIRFFVLDKKGQHAGVAMYSSGEKTFALCTEMGAEAPMLEPLLAGDPTD